MMTPAHTAGFPPIRHIARILNVPEEDALAWTEGRKTVRSLGAAYLRLLRRTESATPRDPQPAADAAGRRPRRARAEPVEGVFGFGLRSRFGAADGALVFRDGRIHGIDETGCRYEGRYVHYWAIGRVIAALTITVPAESDSVFMHNRKPRPVDFTVSLSLPDRIGEAAVPIQTAYGDVFLRLDRRAAA